MSHTVGAFAINHPNDIGAFEFVVTAFSGTVVGDGGHMWPPRANDPRWTQLLSDSGITQSNNFIDDVYAALIALSGETSGALDDLWKKTKLAYGVTDTSEPFLY